MSRAFALVGAGGTGQRFAAPFPKQFAAIDGNSILHSCIENIRDSDVYDHIFVAVPSGYRDRLVRHFATSLDWGDVSVISGGAERRDSIELLLSAAEANWGFEKDDVLSLIDANRPLTTTSVYTSAVGLARVYGASCPIIRVVDGLAELDEQGDIGRIFRRANYARFVTPESFLWSALAQVPAEIRLDRSILGFVEMFVAAEVPVMTFPTDQFSLKVTHPEDWGTYLALREIRRREESGPKILEILEEDSR